MGAGGLNRSLQFYPWSAVLMDAASIALDCNHADVVSAYLSTARSAVAIPLQNVRKNTNVNIRVKKTIAGDCSITLSGSGISFVGYNNAGYNTSPVVILNGATNDYFTINIDFDENKVGVIAVGSKAN